MTKDELQKVIRAALPRPYGTSVDVQIDDNGDVHIEMILLEPHQPFNLEDANSGSKTWKSIEKKRNNPSDRNLKDVHLS